MTRTRWMGWKCNVNHHQGHNGACVCVCVSTWTAVFHNSIDIHILLLSRFSPSLIAPSIIDLLSSRSLHPSLFALCRVFPPKTTTTIETLLSDNRSLFIPLFYLPPLSDSFTPCHISSPSSSLISISSLNIIIYYITKKYADGFWNTK